MKMENIEDSYPLSPLQQGMLFHSLYAPGSGVDIEQIVCTLHENLNVSVFEQAWQRVMERHPVLRTSFRWEDLNQPIQEVHQYIRCPLEQQDWSGLSKREQEAQLDAYLRTDRRLSFDLSKAPLMRLTLFQCAEAEYQFIWTFHHSLLDGRSFVIVLKEVFAFYEAFCQGQDLQLQSPRPYRDYIEWLQQQDFSKAQAFWRQILEGFTTPAALAVDRASARPSGGREGYGTWRIQLSFPLSAALTSALQSMVQEHQLTLNTLVQGAWALLLSHYGGEEDVVFGATRACRRSALEGVGAESMVGFFINTLPVRVRMPPEMPVLAWLKGLRAQSLAVREYEHTPLVKIQEWSDAPRGAPLFETLLVFESYLLNSALQAQGGRWKNREFKVLAHPNYPLTLVGYGGTPILFRLRYDDQRFEEATIRRMFGHIQTLLEGFVANPDQRLSDIPLLTEAEQHQLLVEWNDTRTDRPRAQCFHQLFEAQVERTPDAIAVIFEDEQLTYQELNRRANQLAHHLQTLGVGPEMLVGICMERSLEMMVGLLGILKAGGAYLPLDPTYPEERLAFMMEDAQVSVLLTQKRVSEGLAILNPQSPAQNLNVICLDMDCKDIERAVRENPTSGVIADNLAYVIYTSGSTGRPKGTMISHLGLVNYLIWCKKAYAVAEGSGAPVHSSIGFDLTITALFSPLIAGRSVTLLLEDRGGKALSDVLRKGSDFSLVKITPAHLEVLGQQLLPEKAAGRARAFIIGGEALQGELLTFWRTHSPGTRFVNEYGPTETVVGCCVYEVPAGVSISGSVPIGCPIANTQLYLLNHHLQPVPIGVPGELYISGDGVARGYLNRPDLTAENFIPNPFSDEPGARLYKTGDMARYLPDGNIEFLGRVDHQVKIRGFRVELGEIEAVLAGHPKVRETAVMAREDLPGDKRLVAYFIVAQEPAPIHDELYGFLKEKLPDYMVPSAFVELKVMPLTPNGKVDRRALPAPDTSRRDSKENFVAPRTPTEEVLANIWAETLGLKRVGVYDNFFELGGHSLLVTRVISQLHKTFQVNLPLRTLFEAPTLAALAERIETVCWAAQGPRVSLAGKESDREEIVL